MELDTLKQGSNLHKAWPNEAKDFTPWLAKEEKLSSLSEIFGIGSKNKIFNIAYLI